MPLTLTCPECKNDVDLSEYQNLKKDDVIECNHCGITLLAVSVPSEGEITVEIIEEGK